MQLLKKCALLAAILGYGLSVSQDGAVRGQYNAFKKTYAGSVSDFGSTAVVNSDIEAQRVKVQDAVRDLKNMPVLAVGISYSF